MKGGGVMLGMGILILLMACSHNPSGESKGSGGQEAPDGKPAESRESSVRDAFARQREDMVRHQIEKRGVKDKKVLEAMRKVPRHEFISGKSWSEAYADHPVPIGRGQTISQPYIVAYMTEALALKGTEKVLEIGTGSGYQAAVLAEIVPEVYSIEIICELEANARKTLERLGYENVKTKCADGYKGWPEHAPFDAIIITAAPDQIPPPLLEQLKVGGRLIAPVGTYFQELVICTRTEKGIKREQLLPVRFVPMTGEAEKPGP
jgi:protein-L-isoaspartate(D-aspartate) O-methyltransferase